MGDEHDLEVQKIAIEREKLQIERAKLKIERSKAWWSGVPILAVAATIGFGIWQQHQQARTEFELKTAEIVMNTDNPDVTRNKATALIGLFPGELPADLPKRVDPDKFAVDQTDLSSDLFDVISAHMTDAPAILALWRIVHPDDQSPARFEEMLAKLPLGKSNSASTGVAAPN